jgi:hypothetical protein
MTQFPPHVPGKKNAQSAYERSLKIALINV